MSSVNYKEKRIIQFDEVSHTYTDERNNVYTSATTLIGKYKKPFDSTYWLMWSALKKNNYRLKFSNDATSRRVINIFVRGGYKEFKLKYLYDNEDTILNLKTKAIANEWEKTTEKACDKGNEKHDFLENSVNLFSNTKDIVLDKLKNVQKDLKLNSKVLDRKKLKESPIKDRHPEIYKLLLKYLDAGWTIHVEKRVYSAYHLVAGMIDVLLIKGDRFVILDWKTNKKKLDFEAGYFKKGRGSELTNEWVSKDDKLLYPINNVQDCKGMVYTLQLSLYAFILELWGFKCEKLILCHILDKPSLGHFGIVNEQVDKKQEYDITFYDIKYLKRDVHKMITHFIKTRK